MIIRLVISLVIAFVESVPTVATLIPLFLTLVITPQRNRTTVTDRKVLYLLYG